MGRRSRNVLLPALLFAAAHLGLAPASRAQAGVPPTFVSTTLPDGAVGVLYGADIDVVGGFQPYTFTITSGALPPGFQLTTAQSGNVNGGHVFGGPPAAAGTFMFGVTVSDAQGQMASATISLTIGPAPPNTHPSLLNGKYAFLFDTYSDSSGDEEGDAGSLTFDGQGNVTGIADINNLSGVFPATAVTGTYTVGPDNRGFLTLNAAGMPGSFNAALAIGEVYRGQAMAVRLTTFNDNDGNDNVGAGFLRLQDPAAFTQNSFAGTYVFGLAGQDTGLARAGEVGVISFDNALNVTSGMADFNDDGAVGTITSFGGTYTAPDSNGRVVLNLNLTPGGPTTSVTYIISANAGVVLSLTSRDTSGNILLGTATRQLNPGAFTSNSVAGPAVARFSSPGQGSSNATIALYTVSAAAGPPTISITADSNNGGTIALGQAFAAPYSVAANGRGVFTIGAAAADTFYLYLAAPDRGYIMDSDSDVNAGDFLPQTGTFPPGSNVFFGQFAAQLHEDVSGIGALLSPATFNIVGDDSHVGGRLTYGGTLGAVTFAANAAGHVTLSGTGAGTLYGYVVSPYETDFFDAVDTTGMNSTHPELFVAQTIAAPPGTPSPGAVAVGFATPVPAGTTAQSSPVTITNGGQGPIAFPAVDTSNSPDFSVAGTCLPVSSLPIVQPGGTCTLVVTFMPTGSTPVGTPLNESLIVQSDGTSNVTLMLTGTASSGGAAQLAPNPFMFASPVRTGQSLTVTAAVTLSNTGTGPFDVTGVTNAADFSASGQCLAGLPVTVQADSSCTIDLTFAPLAGAAPGALAETITIATSNGTLMLTVKGTATAPAVTLAPASVAFGAVNVGTPATSSVMLTNSGTAALNVSGISITGANAADFMQTNNCTLVAAGAFCTVNLTFTPSAAGTESATLQIADDATGSPQTIPLNGTGASTSAGFTLTVPAAPGGGNGTTVSVLPGDTAVFTLTLQPNPGFVGQISLACMSGIPATIATAAPTMIDVTMSPSPAVTVTCTLQTNCVTSLVGPSAPGTPPSAPLTAPFAAAASGLALLLAFASRKLATAAETQRRFAGPAWLARLAPICASLALFLFVVTWTACVHNDPPAIPNAPTTPAGVYQIQVVATTQHGGKQTVSLTVHVI